MSAEFAQTSPTSNSTETVISTGVHSSRDSKPATAPALEGSLRETCESVLVAFIMAFMFRTFLAEAFVIPTGSMAPTLQGRHNDTFCSACGKEFRTGFIDPAPGQDGDRVKDRYVTCPNCRHAQLLNPEQDLAEQVYNGDRIIVNKFMYDFTHPQRWDVIVFKFPEDPKTNYIKRLIGLPGDELKIEHGNIWLNSKNGWEIARKPTAEKLLAMLQEVHNNDHQPTALNAAGWPLRWQDWSQRTGGQGWQPSADGTEFSIAAAGEQPDWLKYRHFEPDQDAWARAKKKQPLTAIPKLIKDFYAYNMPRNPDGNYWVGELAVECELETAAPSGAVTLELTKGGLLFQAKIDLTSGFAELAIPTLHGYRPKSKSPVWSGAGTHRLLFANVDDQLRLLVDGKPVEFDAATTYSPLNNNRANEIPSLQPGEMQPSDSVPAGIAVSGTSATLRHLRILRDVYYTDAADKQLTTKIRLLDSDNDDFDQFFMLGDNSPSSSDSRYWVEKSFVERRQLIGKAMYVYWPHSWPTAWSFPIRYKGFEFDFPFWPNWDRMKLIR